MQFDDYVAAVEARQTARRNPYRRTRVAPQKEDIVSECHRKSCSDTVVPGKKLCEKHYAVVMAGIAKKQEAVASTVTRESTSTLVDGACVSDNLARYYSYVPEIPAPDYRMELIGTLVDLARYQLTEPDELACTLARIKRVAM